MKTYLRRLLWNLFKGLPNPNREKMFDGLDESLGFYTSKSFLPLVSKVNLLL